ncbi:MAG: hypothetical protein DRP11_05330 [Candidatus Aenigmatarchaeota archaeon]|nr:MAG: hypothetical protein DRP11_05330 [Candidatus Aenigmarchaeota archaeon]
MSLKRRLEKLEAVLAEKTGQEVERADGSIRVIGDERETWVSQETLTPSQRRELEELRAKYPGWRGIRGFQIVKGRLFAVPEDMERYISLELNVPDAEELPEVLLAPIPKA